MGGFARGNIIRIRHGNIGQIGRLPDSGLVALVKLGNCPIWAQQCCPNQATTQFEIDNSLLNWAIIEFECGNVARIGRPPNSSLVILVEMDDCPFQVW
jgi:hypothetical protein